MTKKTHCGFIAVVGAPNAGKSTLINACVGQKVSIVSPKVQTTRSIVRGIAMHGDAQIVFIDTPGIFDAQQRFDRAMVSAAWQGTADADSVLLIIDVARKNHLNVTKKLVEQISDHNKSITLVMNKIDKMKRDELLSIASALNEVYDFDATFMISALKENGVKDILDYIASRVPEGPWHFPEDQVSDLPKLLLAAEVTREKLFIQLHEELPYGLTVETESWEDFNNGDIKIDQIIYLSREAHKKIVLGKGGDRIKSVGQASREELSEMFETPVHIKLFVKVRENWKDDPERYQALGLDYSS
jgi:GTP-binding protein Era